jgi:hypothetical protein
MGRKRELGPAVNTGRSKGVGPREVWIDRFCFFVFFFKAISNQFQTLFKFKPLNKFSQIFLNYF